MWTVERTASGAWLVPSSNGRDAYTVDPTDDLASGDTCTLIVSPSRVSDLDDNDPPDTMADEATSSFTVADTCTGSYTPIPQIQGSGDSAAMGGAAPGGLFVVAFRRPGWPRDWHSGGRRTTAARS
mgnify:CR=1 FL=1